VIVVSADDRSPVKFHLAGWILFVVCAGFFIASSIRVDDLLGLAGSIIFLVGCVAFIIPLVVRRSKR
jgi:hypothetical protein